MTENNLDRLEAALLERELKNLRSSDKIFSLLHYVTFPALLMVVMIGRSDLSIPGFAALSMVSFAIWLIQFFLSFGIGTMSEKQKRLDERLKQLSKDTSV